VVTHAEQAQPIYITTGDATVAGSAPTLAKRQLTHSQHPGNIQSMLKQAFATTLAARVLIAPRMSRIAIRVLL
jgi:hypothetical protein